MGQTNKFNQAYRRCLVKSNRFFPLPKLVQQLTLLPAEVPERTVA